MWISFQKDIRPTEKLRYISTSCCYIKYISSTRLSCFYSDYKNFSFNLSNFSNGVFIPDELLVLFLRISPNSLTRHIVLLLLGLDAGQISAITLTNFPGVTPVQLFVKELVAVVGVWIFLPVQATAGTDRHWMHRDYIKLPYSNFTHQWQLRGNITLKLKYHCFCIKFQFS